MTDLLLDHTPSDVVRRLLIDLGQGSDGGTWPVYSTNEPDSPDDCITVYDTTGRDYGRDHLGERSEHPGIQVRIRASDAYDGFKKAQAVAVAMDRVVRQTVDLDALVGTGITQYFVYEISRTGNVLPLGKEMPASERTLFTINAVVTLRQTN
jgi:hypothetical protein